MLGMHLFTKKVRSLLLLSRPKAFPKLLPARGNKFITQQKTYTCRNNYIRLLTFPYEPEGFFRVQLRSLAAEKRALAITRRKALKMPVRAPLNYVSLYFGVAK